MQCIFNYLSRSLGLQSFLLPCEEDLEQQHLPALTMQIVTRIRRRPEMMQPITTAMRYSCATCSKKKFQTPDWTSTFFRNRGITKIFFGVYNYDLKKFLNKQNDHMVNYNLQKRKKSPFKYFFFSPFSRQIKKSSENF